MTLLENEVLRARNGSKTVNCAPSKILEHEIHLLILIKACM